MKLSRVQKLKKPRKNVSPAFRKVSLANKIDNLLDTIPLSNNYVKNELNFSFECIRVFNIDNKSLDWILNLEEKNMKTLYESCDWGWDFLKKKKEMTHRKAWYLIAKSAEGLNVGFANFRFDMDYGSAVLYCYEIQLEESVRGLGLGKYLMNLLELIAFSNKMEKVVLTVFKHNTVAYSFFTALGYDTDITSPKDNDKCCYVILSKSSVGQK